MRSGGCSTPWATPRPGSSSPPIWTSTPSPGWPPHLWTPTGSAHAWSPARVRPPPPWCTSWYSEHDDAGTPVPVEKASVGKASAGGEKQGMPQPGRPRPRRGRDHHHRHSAGTRPATPDVSYRCRWCSAGEILPGHTGAAGVQRAAQRHRESFAELPAAAHRLSDGEPVIPTVFV